MKQFPTIHQFFCWVAISQTLKHSFLKGDGRGMLWGETHDTGDDETCKSQEAPEKKGIHKALPLARKAINNSWRKETLVELLASWEESSRNAGFMSHQQYQGGLLFGEDYSGLVELPGL